MENPSPVGLGIKSPSSQSPSQSGVSNTIIKSFNRPISIVIPTCNGQHLFQKFLPSVLKMMRDQDELVIVDDASSDGTSQWLQKGFSLQRQMKTGVKGELFQGFMKIGRRKLIISLLRNDKNWRFAVSCNRGVSLASRDYVLLLNNDVRPTTDLLDYLLPYFANPDVFAVGCLEYEGVDQSAQKGGKNELYFNRGLYHHRRATNFESGNTAWVSGGSGLFDKKKWSFLGGFDEKFQPAYWEDVDLSYRARQQGWQVLFESRAIVFHQHESTNKTELGALQMQLASWQNGQYFSQKHVRGWRKLQNLFWRPYWWRQKKKVFANDDWIVK